MKFIPSVAREPYGLPRCLAVSLQPLLSLLGPSQSVQSAEVDGRITLPHATKDFFKASAAEAHKLVYVRKIVYLSLGSNLGDRAANLEAAIAHLGELGRVVARSSLYETEPVDVTGQGWFLNSAVAVETELMPKQFLSRALAIEQKMGRRRAPAKGPRTIDIDLLLFGGSVVDTPGLVIPHPAMHQRRFVLEPLAEIAPDVRHPVSKKTVQEMLSALPAQSGAVRKLKLP